MSESPSGTDREKGSADRKSEEPEGLSQFLSKILDQLNLSSWLPAIMFVGCGALLVQLSVDRSLDIPGAILALANKPLGFVVVLFFSVILSAIVIQAFSFETIRFLEGYWGATSISAFISRIFIWNQTRRWHRLNRIHRKVELRAFATARDVMLDRQLPRLLVDLLDDQIRDRSTAAYPAHLLVEAQDVGGWRKFARPQDLGPLDRLLSRKAEFPEYFRILPTRLGNVLRSIEDSLRLKDGDLEGVVMRRYDSIPERLRKHHDQFRTRLDMYCTLFLVFLLLTALSVAVVLNANNQILALAFPLSLVALSAISYAAAITSARGYGAALRAIERGPISRSNES